MNEPSLDFSVFSVVDAHVTTGHTNPVPDRWAVDGIALDQEILLVTGLLGVTRGSNRYRVSGVAAFISRESPVVDLDQEVLANFVKLPGGRLVYSHLRTHLNTLAAMVGDESRFPPSPPLVPELVRSSDDGWRVRSPEAEEVSSGVLAF